MSHSHDYQSCLMKNGGHPAKLSNLHLPLHRCGGRTLRFSDCTYARFLQRREEWIEINDKESQTTLKTFQAIPDGLDFKCLVIQQSHFHYTSYRRFTDKSKLERAQKRKEKVADCRADDLKAPSPQKKRMTSRITSSVAGISTSIE